MYAFLRAERAPTRYCTARTPIGALRAAQGVEEPGDGFASGHQRQAPPRAWTPPGGARPARAHAPPDPALYNSAPG